MQPWDLYKTKQECCDSVIIFTEEQTPQMLFGLLVEVDHCGRYRTGFICQYFFQIASPGPHHAQLTQYLSWASYQSETDELQNVCLEREWSKQLTGSSLSSHKSKMPTHQLYLHLHCLYRRQPQLQSHEDNRGRAVCDSQLQAFH